MAALPLSAQSSIRPRAAAAAVVLLCVVAGLLAQQSPAPESTPTAGKGARISFLPPPIDGTLSLGIYDGKGQLVRVLHREADVDEFQIGSDALSTTWDGKNNAGEQMPPGKYHARGYAVGDIGVEGVGYFFNDWVTDDDSARVLRVENLRAKGDGLRLLVSLKDNLSGVLECDGAGNVVAFHQEGPGRFTEEFEPERAAVRVENGSVMRNTSTGWQRVALTAVTAAIDAAEGKDDSLWVIDRADAATEVKQFSPDGALLRRLSISRGDPQPRLIAASQQSERVSLVEESDTMQRVRGLTLVATKNDAGQAVSDWKVEFEKKIVPHAEFVVENGKPVASGRGGDVVEKVKVRLQANPLQEGKKPEVELIAAADEQGSVLKTADGLPLQTISETSGVRRVVIAPSGDKALDLFQDDGAVVEQFRVSNLDRMMAFDCGEFELK